MKHFLPVALASPWLCRRRLINVCEDAASAGAAMCSASIICYFLKTHCHVLKSFI